MKNSCKHCERIKIIHAHGLCKTCYNKEWRAKNPEKVKEEKKRHNNKYPEKVKEDSRRRFKIYYAKCPEKRKENNRKYYAKNSEKVKGYVKKYRQTFMGRLIIKQKNIKRRGNGSIKTSTIEQIINENILKYGVITCEKCKKQCFDNYHIDHIVPVSKGGNNSYNNLQILCAKCNLEKHTEIKDYRQQIEDNQLFLKEHSG